MTRRLERDGNPTSSNGIVVKTNGKAEMGDLITVEGQVNEEVTPLATLGAGGRVGTSCSGQSVTLWAEELGRSPLPTYGS